MFRQPLLPCACLAVALGFAVLAVPAWSQDSSTQERLDRLERDLNMLQRQVYRGGPPPPMPAGGDAAVSAEIRMERLESQMRDLTGRIEEFTNQVHQLKNRVEQINSDVEVRFNQLGSGDAVAAASGAAPPGAPPGAPLGAPPAAAPGRASGSRQVAPGPPAEPDEELSPPHDLAGRGPGPLMPPPELRPPGDPGSVPTPIFGMLRPPGSPPDRPELASTAPPAPAHPPSGGVLPQGSPAQQYNFAFGLLKQADYPAAEAALKAFVDQHPKDAMAGNAQYWLGETYYARGKYMEAAAAFAEGYKRYPKGPKAPDDLLKLGMSLARANQKQNACLAFAQLDHDFPNAGASVKQRSATEKKHIGCS